jgi:DNA-directed RNA polymerase specialized sigma24 family protein
VGIAKRFPRALCARLFHSFLPADDGSFFSPLAPRFPHRFTAHLDPMGVVHQLLRTPELFRPWLYRVASRAAFRHLKKERQSPEQAGDDSVFESVPAPDAPLLAEVLQDLHKMDGIPPASRAVLVLHFREELTLPEVAAILGIPLGTVKSRLAYGLTAVRKQLDLKRSV